MTAATRRPRSTGSVMSMLGIGIEARQLHELLDEVAQPADVADQELRGASTLGRQVVEVLADDRRLGHERGQRRSQLMRDVGHEPPVLAPGRARGGGSSRPANRPSG